MNWHTYEKQAHLKLDQRVREADEWNLWRQSSAGQRRPIARLTQFLSGVTNRVRAAIEARTAKKQDAPQPSIPEPVIEAR